MTRKPPPPASACWRKFLKASFRVRRTGISNLHRPLGLPARLTGVEEILVDMYERPDYVHRLIGRMTDAFLAMFNQYEALNLST